MNKRYEIINNIKDAEDRIFAAKILDCIDQVQKYYEPRYTDFMDPSQITKAKKIIKQFDDINCLVTCGIEDCERNIIAFYPSYMSDKDIDLPIHILSVECKSKFDSISHRDILGALMNLGIKREKIGDIIISDNNYYIIVYSDISYYIALNLTKIKHTPTSVNYTEFKDIVRKQDNFKVIASSIASLRLDCILGCGFGESRSSISKEIVKGSVKVNYEVVTDLSRSVFEGDIISVKGKGRIILESVGGITKKGRINIIIKKII